MKKEKITANGDYNLSGERYREVNVRTHAFPLLRIGDICTINPRRNQLDNLKPNTRVSFVPMADLNENRMTFQTTKQKLLSEVSTSYTYFADNDVLLARVTPCFENGKAGIARGLLNGIGFGSSEFYVLRSEEHVLPEWIYFCVMHPLFRDSAVAQMTGTGGLQRVPRDYVTNFQIPLPPLEVQKELAAEIEGYQKVIDGARAVVDNYRPQIVVDPDWPIVSIGEEGTFRVESGGTPKSDVGEYWGGGIPWATLADLPAQDFISQITTTKRTISDKGLRNSSAKLIPKSSVVVSTRATIGRIAINRVPIATNQGFKNVVVKDPARAVPEYVAFALTKLVPTMKSWATGGTFAEISKSKFCELQISLPSLDVQNEIVAEIEAEQELVSANRELIAHFEKKISAAIGRVWGEVEPDTAEA